MRGAVSAVYIVLITVIGAFVLLGMMMFVLKVPIGQFILGTCGNGECDGWAGETIDTCPSDCKITEANFEWTHIMINYSEEDTFNTDNAVRETFFLPTQYYTAEDCITCNGCTGCLDFQNFNRSIAKCSDCWACNNRTGECAMCGACASGKSDYPSDTIDYTDCDSCLECSGCLVTDVETPDYADNCTSCKWCEKCQDRKPTCKGCNQCIQLGDGNWTCGVCTDCNSMSGSYGLCDACTGCSGETCTDCANCSAFGTQQFCKYCSYKYDGSGLSAGEKNYRGCMGCWSGPEPENDVLSYNDCQKCGDCTGGCTTPSEPDICAMVKDCIKTWGGTGCDILDDVPVGNTNTATFKKNLLDALANCKEEDLYTDLPEGGTQLICKFKPKTFDTALPATIPVSVVIKTGDQDGYGFDGSLDLCWDGGCTNLGDLGNINRVLGPIGKFEWHQTDTWIVNIPSGIKRLWLKKPKDDAWSRDDYHMDYFSVYYEGKLIAFGGSHYFKNDDTDSSPVSVQIVQPDSWPWDERRTFIECGENSTLAENNILQSNTGFFSDETPKGMHYRALISNVDTRSSVVSGKSQNSVEVTVEVKTVDGEFGELTGTVAPAFLCWDLSNTPTDTNDYTPPGCVKLGKDFKGNDPTGGTHDTTKATVTVPAGSVQGWWLVIGKQTDINPLEDQAWAPEWIKIWKDNELVYKYDFQINPCTSGMIRSKYFPTSKFERCWLGSILNTYGSAKLQNFVIPQGEDCSYNVYLCGQRAITDSPSSSMMKLYNKTLFFNVSDSPSYKSYPDLINWDGHTVGAKRIRYPPFTVSLDGTYSAKRIADAMTVGWRDWGWLNSDDADVKSELCTDLGIDESSCGNRVGLRITGDVPWNLTKWQSSLTDDFCAGWCGTDPLTWCKHYKPISMFLFDMYQPEAYDIDSIKANGTVQHLLSGTDTATVHLKTRYYPLFSITPTEEEVGTAFTTCGDSFTIEGRPSSGFSSAQLMRTLTINSERCNLNETDMCIKYNDYHTINLNQKYIFYTADSYSGTLKITPQLYVIDTGSTLEIIPLTIIEQG